MGRKAAAAVPSGDVVTSKGSSQLSSHRMARRKHAGMEKWCEKEEQEKSDHEKHADRLLDRQIDIPLYMLLALLVSHALSGTSSLSLPYLSTHLPHSIQTLLPAWARQLPILAPFATDLPNASHDSKQSGPNYWTTGYAGPFRSDAAGFGHPLTALHNFTRACLGLSYAVEEPDSFEHPSFLHGDSPFGRSYIDRYPWNSWTSYQSQRKVSLMQGKYEKGAKDILFIGTAILMFILLRALAIRYILIPLGRQVVEARDPVVARSTTRAEEAERRKWRKGRRKSVTRFAEQAWSATYYFCSLLLSLYIARREPYWMNEKAIWSDWPYNQLSGLSKAYYLLQCAFALQQVLVLNVEERRKDHWQMFTHHIITIMLLVGSYTFHFTPIGNVVLILMDPADILLSSAKCLRYMGLQTLCDIFFGLFMVSWIITRHFFYWRMLWSCIKFGLALQARNESATLTFTFVALLSALQCLLLIWLIMILRLAWRVVSGQNAEDDRSDEESADEEEPEEDVRRKGPYAKGTTSPFRHPSTGSLPPASRGPNRPAR